MDRRLSRSIGLLDEMHLQIGAYSSSRCPRLSLRPNLTRSGVATASVGQSCFQVCSHTAGASSSSCNSLAVPTTCSVRALGRGQSDASA
eukprot:CAMPEP_0206240082 /NCGR_PEP_ID=MMETSP0047_2-20121206/15743_2 /ASSEMBLY_ACC=CAM_ASM_000192 /TAXON_ID=195065 /ORGANISM="Chroomonas mesostigmatica_cf, Strain CCMP1168" /LENGTH=88 /DNA_ID=CAMNT_0053664829 /DNA_START=240 /DNA_END=503 /DNA_ORIENTATION=-